jgi:hypothetical protein
VPKLPPIVNYQTAPIHIETRDGKTLKIDRKIAQRSGLIKEILESRTIQETTDPIPLTLFESSLVSKVFEFLKHELEVEKLPMIPRPLTSEKLQDFLPPWFVSFMAPFIIKQTSLKTTPSQQLE